MRLSQAKRTTALLILTTGLASDCWAAGDKELGQYLSAECVTCHRVSGPPAQGIPQILGWPEDQFIAVMTAYKEKQRDNPVMQTVASRLTADDIAALAAFFGGQKPSKSN